MMISRLVRIFINMYNDIRIGGMFLGGTIKSEHINEGANDIANTDYTILDQVFSKIPVSEKDVITDVGCGKGRVLNYLLLKNVKCLQIIGIELDKTVGEFTVKRLKKYSNVKVIQGDVLDNIPSKTTIFYLFNPFKKDIMEKFLCRVEAVIMHEVVIIYVNDVHIELFSCRKGYDIICRFLVGEKNLGVGGYYATIIKYTPLMNKLL